MLTHLRTEKLTRVAREQPAEKIDHPLLQRLGQQRVIRLGEGRACDRLLLISAEAMLIGEAAASAHDGNCNGGCPRNTCSLDSVRSFGQE